MDINVLKGNDKLLAEQNPGKTPHDLLLLGLTQRGYNALIKSETDIKNAPQPRGAEQVPIFQQSEETTSTHSPLYGANDGLLGAGETGATAATPGAAVEATRSAATPGPMHPVRIVSTGSASEALAGPTQPQLRTNVSHELPTPAGFATRLIMGPTGIPQTMNANRAAKLVARSGGKYQFAD